MRFLDLAAASLLLLASTAMASPANPQNGVDSAPTLIIDGRYMSSPSTVDAGRNMRDRNRLFQETLQVADALVAKAAQSK